MTLVDTGPLVALFDPRDPDHDQTRSWLKRARVRFVTTDPVLTEAFHLLAPASRGAQALRKFVLDEGLAAWHLDDPGLTRAFRLMERYRDHPMDLADASLVVAAERLGTRKVWTLDRDFAAYRIRRGRRRVAFDVRGR